MKKMLFIAGIALCSTQLVANELDALGDIQLVDESDKSALFQKGPIVGCSDHKKKEMTCSKKPEDVILSQLPTSQQLDEKDLDNEEDSNEIKEQLKNILAELSALKQKQKANKSTISELRSLVKVLSNEKPTIKAKDKLKLVKKTIKRIQPKKSKVYRQTLIKKPIKEIAVYDDHVVIEVQNNESLSTYAQVYYNDNTQYYRIYKANKDKINKNLQIIIGDRLIIPGASSYKN
jgi:predicted nuclease with TOPRIM domain